MKKLMIVAAAAAMVASAQAIVVTNCAPVDVSVCDAVVFKVTASGKITDEWSKDYTTVSKLKISKGALVMLPSADPNGSADCCYDNYSLYVTAKFGKESRQILVSSEPIDSWSLFGKNQDDAWDALQGNTTKSKKYKLESQLGIAADSFKNDGSAILDAADIGKDDGTFDILFVASAFGKGTVNSKYTKASCNSCGKTDASVASRVTPGNYSGWFAGLYQGSEDEICFSCQCAYINVFGGTWKAKYDSSRRTWQAAADYVFGSSIRSNMADADVE